MKLPNMESLRKTTVLICEDDAIIRMDTADLVQELGHVTMEAATAKQALEIVAKQEIDISLTDVGLPDISGIELVQRVRALKPAIAVIFATGPDHVEGFNAASRTELLKKPYRLLQKALNRILR